MNPVIRNVIMLVVFVVCLALVLVGQKNISATGLAMELVGHMHILSLY